MYMVKFSIKFSILLLSLLWMSCSNEKSSTSSFDEEPFYPDSLSIPYKMLLNDDEVKNIFGSDHFKLVVRNENNGNLGLLEYKEDSLNFREFDFGIDSYHPTISPDGSKIAFCSVFEGLPDPSKLYVVDLNTEKIDSLNVASAAIPRWYVLPNGDTTIVYVDFPGNNQSVEWLSSGTWQVTYQNNEFGIPKKLFNRSFNGGVSYDYSVTATGSPKLLYHFAKDDDSVNSDYYNDEQACNVSISRDSLEIISFLETGGAIGKQFTHDRRGTGHYYIFYQNKEGEIIKAIPSLENTVFDHVEWINVSGLQVGIIVTANAEYNRVAVIDYQKSKVTLLIQSANQVTIWHPDLWVDTGE